MAKKQNYDSIFLDLWRNGNSTKLYQPNNFTNASVNYSLVQMKLFVLMIEKLQSAILKYNQKREDGRIYTQLDLFNSDNLNTEGNLTLTFQLKEFGFAPNRYDELRKSAMLMASIPIELREKPDKNGEMTESTIVSLVHKINIIKGKRTFDVTLSKESANFLISLDEGYTNYIKEIALSMSSPYMMKLYMYLSSWANKGGVSITLKKFRKLLSIENKYSHFRHIEQFIITPAHQYLKQHGDIFFEYSVNKDETTNQVDTIDFKIVKRLAEKQLIEKYHNEYDNMIYVMKEILCINENHLNVIKRYMAYKYYTALELKIEELCKLKNNYAKYARIRNKSLYFANAIMKVIGNGEKIEK